jgi:hypothetical protein
MAMKGFFTQRRKEEKLKAAEGGSLCAFVLLCAFARNLLH